MRNEKPVENAFTIKGKSSFAQELQENARRSQSQSRHVTKQRKKGIEPMRLHLANSGTMQPKDRA